MNKKPLYYPCYGRAALAQQAERHHGNVEVAGSIPASSSMPRVSRGFFCCRQFEIDEALISFLHNAKIHFLNLLLNFYPGTVTPRMQKLLFKNETYPKYLHRSFRSFHERKSPKIKNGAPENDVYPLYWTNQ